MAKRDCYDVLGIGRTASAAEIKKAYRRLARKYHPDATGDTDSEAEQFKEVQEAYEILSDTKKRQMYDRFGHAGMNMGQEPFPGGGRGAAHTRTNMGGPGASGFNFADFFGGAGGGGVEDIFEQLHGRTGRRSQRAAPRGQDIHHAVKVSFDEAVSGTTRDIVMTTSQADGAGPQQRLSVKIPPGVDSGSKIRLRGKGQRGATGNNGDLIITIEVEPHAYFERRGADILLDVPVTVSEAALGAKVDVPTLSGITTVTIPAGSSSGRRLRLKEKGIKTKKGDAGDMFLNLKIVLPEKIDKASEQLLNDFAQTNPQPDLRDHWLTL